MYDSAIKSHQHYVNKYQYFPNFPKFLPIFILVFPNFWQKSLKFLSIWEKNLLGGLKEKRVNFL